MVNIIGGLTIGVLQQGLSLVAGIKEMVALVTSNLFVSLPYLVAFLQQAGFTKVHNLAGGITAWSDRVDPKIPKY